MIYYESTSNKFMKQYASFKIVYVKLYLTGTFTVTIIFFVLVMGYEFANFSPIFMSSLYIILLKTLLISFKLKVFK